VHCCVTSPPYWGLRDYGHDGQIGLEATPAEYVARMVLVFAEVRRVLRNDGTLWLNLGDSYAASGMGGNPAESEHRKQATNVGSLIAGRKPPVGLKVKDLIGIPWRVAFALQDDGWFLRQDIIWHKPNPMPESVTDRCTKSHEYVFLLAKSARYWYDAEAISEPVVSGANGSDFRTGKTFLHQRATVSMADRVESDTRNARSVWTIPTQPYKGAHFATFPEALAARCIKAGCPVGGTVLDPFTGSGTTLAVAVGLGRNGIGTEINPAYASLARQRIGDVAPLLAEEVA